jgi:3-oxoacyl-[acyl-carrier protein] reductase
MNEIQPGAQAFKDQVVIVTGAGRGLGRALALAFANLGAIVAVNDLSPVNLDETVARILADGGRVKDYIFDVAKKIPVQTMLQQIVADFGRVDILINNAGVAPRAQVLEMDEWDWHRTMDVNLGGAFFMMQVVGRIMRQQGGGVIVNIALSERWAQALTGRAAFVASKVGLVGLTRLAAHELAAEKIRVHAVCPPGLSFFETGDFPATASVDSTAIVRQVLWLCSSQAKDLNGQVIEIEEA